jgi:hypothetical protein
MDIQKKAKRNFGLRNYQLLDQFIQTALKGTSIGLMAMVISVPAMSVSASRHLVTEEALDIPTAGQVDEEFQSNTYTTGDQLRPSVAMDANGSFVIAWQSEGSVGLDADSFSIQAQLYNKAGNPVGEQFQVNDYAVGSQSAPSVAMDAGGDFVVAWQSTTSTGTDSSGSSIQARRFDRHGQGSSQFQINTSTVGEQQYPSVSMDADGVFVVVWQSDDSVNKNVYGRVYNSSGTAQGVDFQINSYSTGSQLFPDVAMDSSGDYVVVWSSNGTSPGDTDTSRLSIQGQRYRKNIAEGDQFQVNTYTMNNQIYPAVGVDVEGDFIVVWQSYGSDDKDNSGFSIQGQRYKKDGEVQGDQFEVNTYTSSNQFNAAIAVDNDANFVVTWESFGSDQEDVDPFSIQGQRFFSSGDPDGDEFQINEYTTGNQNRSSVAIDNEGNYIVAWESDGSFGSDTDSKSVQGHAYPKPPGAIFLPIVGRDF